MPSSDPPHGARAHVTCDHAVVDSGWSSLPPAAAAIDNFSGVQPLPSQRRKEGTLLGVAPPRSPASLPSRRNPVVVHAGLSPDDSGAQSIRTPDREAELPIPTLPIRAREATSHPGDVPDAPRNLPGTPSYSGADLVAPPAPLPALPEARLKLDTRPDVSEPHGAPVLKPPVAAISIPVRNERSPVDLFQAMSLPVRSLGFELPLWAILVPLLLSLLAVCSFSAFAAGSRRSAQPAAVASAPPVAAARLPSAPPTLDSKAIEAKAAEARTAVEALALAELATERKREAAARFNQGLLQAPTSLQKKSTVAELRRLVSDPLTAQQTLAAVASLPGPMGPDVLYELWSATPNKTDATELARSLLSSQDVRGKASKALSMALHLRAIDACGDVGPLLDQARQVGDKRSLGPLAKWKRKRVCSAKGQRDCCSSDSAKDIAATIDAVKGRRSPLEGT
jgi:hypothetical protein